MDNLYLKLNKMVTAAREPDETAAGTIEELRLEKEALEARNSDLSDQLITVLASKGEVGPSEAERLRRENEAFRMVVDEMNKNSTGGLGRLDDSRAEHEMEILRMEAEGLREEVSRLKGVISQMSGAKASPKYSPEGYKMLEDQVKALEEEVRREREKAREGKVEAERARQAERASVEAREEAALLRSKVSYFEQQAKDLSGQQALREARSQEMLEKLREEVRTLKEAEHRSSVGTLGSAGLGTSPGYLHGFSGERSPHSSQYIVSDATLVREKNMLETALAKAERELRERDKTIVEMKKKADETGGELAKLKKAGESAGKNGGAINQKELDMMRQRMHLMEERERELLDSENLKDLMIKELRKQIDEMEKDNSIELGGE